MQPNNSLSFDQSNQFMPSMPKNNSGPSFQNFMQACFTNPTFFQSMKQFYVTQAHKPTTQPMSSSYQGLATQSYHQSQPNLANQSRKQVKYEQDNKSQQFQREVDVTKSNDMKRKPANPLAKYFPTQNTQTQKANQPLSKPTTAPPPKPTFEDKPIKSNYINALNNNSQAFDLNTIKENQSVNIDNPKKKVKNFDDEPIKGIQQYQMESFYKQPEEKIKSSATTTQDQRPIKGFAKDFKQVVKQRFPNALEKDDEQQVDQSSARKCEPRTFLKRGSRQHLSSAVNRSKQPKNNLDNSLNKSGIQEQRDRSVTPKRMQPQNRNISQSKGIQNKKTTVQEKSTSKLPTKKNDSSDQEPLIGKNKPYLPKQRPAKPEQKSVRNLQKNETKEIQGKGAKRKNVFNDDSQSSSSEQERLPTFKTKNNQPKKNYKNSQMEDYQNKLQVIQGVYLTQQQLDQIVLKYGKVKQVPKQSQSEKVAALRRKYNQMIALKDEEMQKYKQQLQREREEFQKYKADQLTKLKNERRVMQRQVKGGSSNQNLQKEKQQLQNLRQDLQKQKEDFKRKDKNNKIIIQKYKKQNQQLKSKIDKIQSELNLTKKSVSGSARVEDNVYEEKLVSNKSINGSLKGKKPEQQQKSQQVTYKDLKKTANKPPVQDNKQIKNKYQYVQQDTFSKNKSFSSKMDKKQPKIQNKWASHKFTNSDQSQSENQDQQQYQVKATQSNKTNQWSPAMKLSDLTKTSLSIKMVNDQMIDSLFRFQKNIQYLRYIQSTKLPTRTVVNTARNNTNSYTTKIYSDRTKQLVYDNGTRKVSCENGYSIVYFKNGDIKQTLPDKTVLYYFKQKEVDQITLSNGVNIYRFQNNQVEFHFQNGYIEIRHPDGTIKVLGDHIRK